jgi:hypothetical protein
MLTDNERDLIAVLEFAISTKNPPERITGAMKRLLAQLPQPETVDVPDGVRRKEFLQRLQQPATWTPLPSPPPDGEVRREFLEQLKKPMSVSKGAA